MRISQGIPNLYISYNKPINQDLLDRSYAKDNINNFCTYPAVYFCGKISPKQFISVKEQMGSFKEGLVKKLDDILKNDITEKEMTKEEIQQMSLNRTTAFMLHKEKKSNELDSRIMLLWQKIQTNALQPQALLDERNILAKEYNKLQKLRLPKIEHLKPKQKDEQTDFALINKFKSAVMEDNFDLKKVFIEHYSLLNEVKTAKEVSQKYPKMKIPKNPKDVVAKRICLSLTRDFYEELDSIYEAAGKKEARSFIRKNSKIIIDNQLKSVPEEKKKIISKKLVPSTVSAIAQSYRKIKDSASLKSVPVARKMNKSMITDLDKRLLLVDYDNFVISTLKEQYLGLKKPNDIVYNSGDTVIKISELKGTDYKFPRIPIKTKCLLDDGEKAKSVQRGYDSFTQKDFIDRLEFQLDRIETNDVLLNKYISFSTCEFTPEDINNLKLFLKEGDKILDGEKSVDAVVNEINYRNIRPYGTERLNDIERQKHLQKIKLEQKHHTELVRLQKDFDNNINILYQNGMAYIAELCSKYRPISHNIKEKINADKISAIILEHMDGQNTGKLLNKERVASKITRFNKYMEYKKTGENQEIMQKAISYARGNDGLIDSDKAGKYIINYEAVLTYPESFEYAHNKEAAETIMNNCKTDKNKAVEYLCKYDDYIDLSHKEKMQISQILKIFDKKDVIEKDLLKNVIENEYVKIPTVEWSKVDETGSKKVKATIAPKAKSMILDYYGFPKCLEYFNSFENALPQFATKRASAGIKKLGKNWYELKILDEDDRLVANNGNYYFDDFTPIGFHKN